MMKGNSDLAYLDDKKRMKMDSLCQETTPPDHVPTHPAVLGVFRTDNILEEICSHLGFNDLKQFRLVTRTCNEEGRRALIKRDRHWVVVKLKDDDWKLGLDEVLIKLEETNSASNENCHKKLQGWIFKRLELNNWYHSLRPYLLRQWGHYLRKIHLKTENYKYDKFPTFRISHVVNTMHNLLTVCCPNLDEMVVELKDHKYFARNKKSLVVINELDSLEFPPSLPKLKCLRIKNSFFCSSEETKVLQRFFTKLVRAAATALETLQITFQNGENLMIIERKMLESLAVNVGVSNFQSLKEISLHSDVHVAMLSHTVQTCFPELAKLIVREVYRPTRAIRPESFPALKTL